MALGGLGVESEEHGLQIAPLLDILFVLLLFFMVMAASQKIEQGLKLQLTSTGTAYNQDKPTVPIFLKIHSNLQIYFNENPIDSISSHELPALKKRLSTIAKLYGTQHPILILPEANVPYQRIIDALNACTQSQMQNVQLNTSSP
ncbi:MAG: biopolymer transporter ExbD [Verrucomicrobiae bacterium]|nr:biopolymer transporter ExbD [Verrucomicrobiae bacterium]